MSDRMRILDSLLQALEPMGEVIACWEAGSKATGRLDQYSDLDLQLLVEDGAVDAVRRAAEQALQRLAPFAKRYELPRPSWHGHWQAFYQLQGFDPLLLVDLVIMERKAPARFLEPEIHGVPTVYFDKEGQIKSVPTDAAAFAEKLSLRLPALEEPMELFHPFVEKELRRGREIDAIVFYQSFVVNRLVEALRMRYSPWRYNFGARYLQYDLPPAVYARVRELYFVAGPAELAERKAAALAWLRETLAELKTLDFVSLLEDARR
ncbi:MAG TPA: hypothetical protein VD969_28355 [Symbiobacteriaceae bacterium]|nr:hypothetical protein [Symbiobacteriaceae bacterium]